MGDSGSPESGVSRISKLEMYGGKNICGAKKANKASFDNRQPLAKKRMQRAALNRLPCSSPLLLFDHVFTLFPLVFHFTVPRSSIHSASIAQSCLESSSAQVQDECPSMLVDNLCDALNIQSDRSLIYLPWWLSS